MITSEKKEETRIARGEIGERNIIFVVLKRLNLGRSPYVADDNVADFEVLSRRKMREWKCVVLGKYARLAIEV